MITAIFFLFAVTQTPPVFDVASVKPSTQTFVEIFPKRSGGRITWTTDLRFVINYAYGLPLNRIQGAIPSSDHTYHFEVATNADATDAQVREMFQTLLADRFKMKSHRETKQVDSYVLSVSKPGKLKPATPGENPPLPKWLGATPPADVEGKAMATMPESGIATITGRRVPIAKLCEVLARVLGAPVLDNTGLAGNFYFDLRFAHGDQTDADAPSVFSVIRDELGLKLDGGKHPVEMLIIDSIEKTPVEN